MDMMKAYQFNSAMTAAQAGADSFRAFSAMNIALLMDTCLLYTSIRTATSWAIPATSWATPLWKFPRSTTPSADDNACRKQPFKRGGRVSSLLAVLSRDNYGKEQYSAA